MTFEEYNTILEQRVKEEEPDPDILVAKDIASRPAVPSKSSDGE